MFDPTIFDNLKTVLEGEIYDRDLEGEILITDRNDWIDLATMARTFVVQFRIQDCDLSFAAIRLHADIKSLSAEILESTEVEPGCDIEISFSMYAASPQQDAMELMQTLSVLWQGRPSVRSEICFGVDDDGEIVESIENKPYLLKLILSFDRKINEGQLDDLTSLIQVVIASLEACNRYAEMVE